MAEWEKDIVYWTDKGAVYISVVFTWQLPQAEKMAEVFKNKGRRIIAGGPAVQLMGAPWADETMVCFEGDVLWRYNSEACFTSRGCINKCPFCAVPKIEGEFREIDDYWLGRIICDNNITASSQKHFKKLIDDLIGADMNGVDFNQGLDARLFKPWHAEEISRLRRPIKVRFSFDNVNMESAVYRAVSLANNAGIGKKHISIYVLIGFDDTPDDARYRLDLVRSWGVTPFAMRYQPLDACEKNNYVRPGSGWTQNMLAAMVRFYNHDRWWGHLNFEDYQGGNRDQLDLFSGKAETQGKVMNG